MRYDLAFFMCCCKSFLGPDDEISEDNYYSLLQVSKDASPDDIKRAYKKQSLQIHPDKLAQRGITVTVEHQNQFTKMKEAYEVLSDEHKRETYDAIGSKGMRYLDEPFSIDPSELLHNFAKSSVVDRSKIFGIFVAVAVIVLLQPILVCLNADGAFGPDSLWITTLIPLWIWNLFLLFYHVRVILMGPIPKPEHIPENEWVDPLPMKKRVFSMIRFCLIFLFELLIALKVDNIIGKAIPYAVLFIPYYLWEITTLYKKIPIAKMRIVTVEDLETAMQKPFSEFTNEEKEIIGKRYSVVSSLNSPDYDIAYKLKLRARHDILKSIFRILFVVLLLVKLDGNHEYNWFVVFLPFWILMCITGFNNYQNYLEVQQTLYSKDPTLYGYNPMTDNGRKVEPSTAADGDVETGKKPYDNSKSISNHSTASSTNDGRTPFSGGVSQQQPSTQANSSFSTSQPPPPPSLATAPPPAPVSELTEEEREELKAQDMASKSRLCSKCCSQTFVLLILILIVSKLQGATFSSFWIISPFLLFSGIVLCILGFAIFGVTEVPTDGIDFENSQFAYTNLEHGSVSVMKPMPSTVPTNADVNNNAKASLKFDSPFNNAQSQTTDYVDDKNVASTVPEMPSTSQEATSQPQQDLDGITKSNLSASSVAAESTQPASPIVMTQPVQYECFVVLDNTNSQVSQSNAAVKYNPSGSQCESNLDECLPVHDLD